MMEEFRRRLIGMTPEYGLPKGYFRCEYIESDGTNFIDTGFKPNQDTSLTIETEGQGSTTCIFGVDSGFLSKGFGVFTNTVEYGSSSKNHTIDSSRHIFQLDKGAFFLDNELKHEFADMTFSCEYNLCVFALNRKGNTQEHTSAKLYSCQIYDNGVKVRDYVPCVSPEGYFGLYDLVTDEFYGFVQQKTARSYTVNLGINGYWSKGGFANPDSSKYDAYRSKLSKGFDYGYDIMRITINGYDEFTCYIRSYAESYYDYTIIGNLDVVLNGAMSSDSSGVKAHTRGNQNGGTDINSYTKVVYTGIGGGTHFIDVMYRKDGSGNSADDRGYLLIDKSTVSSGGTIQVIGRGKVILPIGYTNAEYIAGDGNAWFDIGFAPNQDTRVVCDFSFSSEGQIAIFGGRTANQSSDFSFWRISGNVFLSNYNASSHSSSVTSTGRFTVDKDKNVTKINGYEDSSSYGTFQSPYSLYLFNVNSKNKADTRVGPLSMFYCAVFDNGEFVRLFVPCKYVGVFGMYDMIEGIFYSSEGSSEFKDESDGDNEGSGSLPDYSAYRGVYIEDVDGYLYAEAEWDGSKTANGVAVLTDNCRFVIALQGSNTTKWTDPSFYNVEGVTNTDIFTDACKDYNGRNNTDVMISDLNTGALSANYCKSYDFPNGQKGYLGAAGEWQSALDNKAAIESALSKCGGTSLDEGITEFYWTSTQYTDFESWVANWSYVVLTYADKSLDVSVRAFTPLKQDVQIISFGIGDVEYQAEEGMTWGKWIDSKFNTDGYFIEASGNYIADASGNYIGLDGVFVRPSEVIQEGTSYLLV